MKDSSIDSRIREENPEGAKAMDSAPKVLDQHGAGATIDPSLKESPEDKTVPVRSLTGQPMSVVERKAARKEKE